MTNCWFCGCNMIWNSDFDYEDYGLDGDGIVAVLSCLNCEAFAEFYSGCSDKNDDESNI